MSGYQVDLGGQYYTTLISLLVGGGLCLLYDCFRIVRAAWRWDGVAVFVQDVVYCVIAAAVTYGMLLVRCSGVVRIYPLIGEVCGFVICRFTVSRLVMLIATGIITFVRRVYFAVRKAAFVPIIRIAETIFKKIAAFSKKINYLLKNYLKDTSYLVYNHVNYRGRKNDESK